MNSQSPTHLPDQNTSLSPETSKTVESNDHRTTQNFTALQSMLTSPVDVIKQPNSPEALPEENGRERLRRHRMEVAGRVWIPDIWGQEELLKDWIDCSVFDAALVPTGIMSARAALVEEGRRANSGGLRIENRC